MVGCVRRSAGPVSVCVSRTPEGLMVRLLFKKSCKSCCDALGKRRREIDGMQPASCVQTGTGKKAARISHGCHQICLSEEFEASGLFRKGVSVC